jgi:hypothetical protein
MSRTEERMIWIVLTAFLVIGTIINISRLQKQREGLAKYINTHVVLTQGEYEKLYANQSQYWCQGNGGT